MTAARTLLVVDPPASVAAGLDARADVTAVYAAAGEVVAALDREAPAAVVVPGDATLDDRAVAALAAAGAPVVALADEPPTAGYVEGFVAAGPDPVDRLVREVEHAIAGETRIQLVDARERATRLHEAVPDLVDADTEAELFDAAVGIAERVLSFDRAAFLRRTDDGFVTVAATDDAADRGPAGGALDRAVDERRTVLVDGAPEPVRAPSLRGDVRSAIAVPVGDDGVFRALSDEPGAFDDDDADRAESLVTHVAASLGRVRARAGLRRERDRLSALFENMPDAAAAFELVDGEPVVTDVNDNFEASFGYAREAVVGGNLDEFVVPPDRADEAAALNGRVRKGEVVRTEVRRLTADGESDFMAVIVPRTPGEATAAGHVIYPDITCHKERERELERQNERLDEFASVVSHDLRSPLAVADGYLELARETGEAEHFETVEGAIERMRRLVDDLLALAREGRVVGDAETVALDWAAEGAWNSVGTGAATLDASGVEGTTVSSDPERLRELFENLFHNAVEHGGDGVAVRVERVDGGFAVSDDGPGVPEAERDRVFAPGVSGAADGTGFGLPIVRRIAEAHGWRVNLGESDAGGARFAFAFE